MINELIDQRRLKLMFAIVSGEYVDDIRTHLHNNRDLTCSVWAVQMVWLYIIYAVSNDLLYRYPQAEICRAFGIGGSIVSHVFTLLQELGHLSNYGKGPYNITLYKLEIAE